MDNLTSLRDRIAAVLHSLYGKSFGYADEPWERLHTTGQDEYRSDADAVIEALGLNVEAGVIVGCLHDG